MNPPSSMHLLNSFEEILQHVAAAKYLAARNLKNHGVGILDGVTANTTVGLLLRPLFRTRRIVSQFIYPALGVVVKETIASVQKRIERQRRKEVRDSKKLSNN